jgi:predicted transcriptional regulator
MMYNGAMNTAKHVRRSVTLSREVARQVDAIARHRRLSDNRVLVDLIEQGLEARKQKEKAFFDLAERFRAAANTKEAQALGEELGRFVFGD